MNVASPMASGAALARLQPLLAPRSIAVYGATPREGSFGRTTIEQIVAGGFTGRLFPVNPKYPEIVGLPAFPTLKDLPEVPDHAVIVLANAQVEEAVDAVIGAGVKAATLFASCYLEGDTAPLLTQRIRVKARAAGLRLCGANCLGFQNREHALSISVFPPGDLTPGNIAVVSHSGSAFLAMATLDPRFRVNLIVSAGQELSVGAADYMAYALDRPSTRAIALFLETVRDPAGFVAALERANAQEVPVVALKVGRTEKSARLAQTHSGALTGNDAAYQAVFDHYGVHRVDSVDELTATALLFASPRRYVKGGLGAVFDSGGQRGMMLDLAGRAGLPIAEIGAPTRDKLAAALDYGLEPVNPVDAWGTGRDFHKVFSACYRALAEDPNVGVVALFSDVSIDDPVASAMLAEFCDAADATPAKPFVVVLNWSRCLAPKRHLDAFDRGVAVLDGVETGVGALRRAVEEAAYRARPAIPAPPEPDPAMVARWRARLKQGTALAEHESLSLLADFGVPTIPFHRVADEKGAIAAAAELGYPVALKTAEGIQHKTEAKGVHLNLADEAAARRAYDDLADRLGPHALVMPMAASGVEMALGVVMDPDFGPLVMVGAGGVLVETLEDRAYLLAGTDAWRAERALERLRIRKALAGVRGRPPADVVALFEAIVRLGQLAHTLHDVIAEIDVNPIIATHQGVVAVDALVIPRGA